MYTDEQLDAIRYAQEVLQRAGLQPADIFTRDFPFIDGSTPLFNYIAPKARMFTKDELKAKMNRVTRESYIDGIVDHPIGAVLEFPETGDQMGRAIGHIFRVDHRYPEQIVNPKDNVQFSLGGSHGQHNVECLLLRDQLTGDGIPCRQTNLQCCSVKICSFVSERTSAEPPTPSISLDASGEVFMKTLGFFCALKDSGCLFTKDPQYEVDNGDPNEFDNTSNPSLASLSLIAVLKDSRSRRDGVAGKLPNCTGSLLLEKDKYNHHFVRCEYYAKGHCNHLRIRNLNEYNIDYLSALFKNDVNLILQYETVAATEGYGPLAPCNFTCTAREQKELCPTWHCDIQGILQQGTMKKMEACQCRFEIYQPRNLERCPYILVVSRNPHSHPLPARTKTPESIRDVFISLLRPLDWRLADATPRRLLLDNTFIYSLRQLLGWVDLRDPGLGDLHPSLNNYDHAARLIDDLRRKRYPNGTGLEGAKALLEDHESLADEERYIRCVETCELAKEGKFYIVICMFKAMSHLLLKTTRPSIDTSFKRLNKWQEFEIEAWFPEYSRSIVVARAFTTSQSASAHQILFQKIFKIVEEDTGEAVHFRHIHGDGFDTITADGHQGQALGLGLYCQDICKTMTKQLSPEWSKPLSALTSTQHLACFYRYCFAHYTRNVNGLRSHVKENVRSAMMSLASSTPLPDFEKVKSTIRNGGKKASDWLKDKEKNDGFMLAAVYQPLSRIPIEIWRAAPSTSNGNEQAHRNINRDGTKLTMLAGIMRGLQFDSRALRNIDIWMEEYIPPRDRLSTHFRRSARAVQSKANSQKKIVMAKDVEIRSLYNQFNNLQGTAVETASTVKRALDESEDFTTAQKRLRASDKQLHETVRAHPFLPPYPLTD